MFQPVYLIWGLLPLAFFGFAAWAFLRPYFGVHGHESTGEFARQFVFVLLSFVIAIWLDQRILSDESGSLSITGTEGEAMVVHWLLYPFVLMVLAYLNRAVNRALGKEVPTDLSQGLARYRR